MAQVAAHKPAGRQRQRRMIMIGALAVGLVVFLRLRGSLFGGGTPTGVVATPDPTATDTGTLGGTTSTAGDTAASDPNLISALTGSLDTLTTTAQALQDAEAAFLQAQQDLVTRQSQPPPPPASPQVVITLAPPTAATPQPAFAVGTNPGGPETGFSPFAPPDAPAPASGTNPGGQEIIVTGPPPAPRALTITGGLDPAIATAIAVHNAAPPPPPAPPRATPPPVAAPVIVHPAPIPHAVTVTANKTGGSANKKQGVFAIH